jgi:hypothetical protein
MANELLYVPHNNQVEIHASKARYRTVVAGRRFGKSALALNEAIARAMQLERQVVWIILPKYRQAKEIYWVDPDITKYFMPYVMAGLMKKNEQELSLYVHQTQSWIRLKGADNYDSLRGSGLDLIIWDEVADVKEKSFETIEPALADSPDHRVLYIGTPKGLNHFHDYALRGDHKGIIPQFDRKIQPQDEWETWHFTSYDNLTWAEGSYEREMFVKYIDGKRREAEEKGRSGFFNQEYMASFEESAGRFFPKWAYSSHVMQHIELPHLELPRYGSMDWGRSAPFAWYSHVLVNEIFQGRRFNRIITFRERYATGMSPYEQAEAITGRDSKGQTRILDYATIKDTWCDPSMFAKMGDNAISIAKQFVYAFETITGKRPILKKANNDRKLRWAAMDNWMRLAPDGMPYWIITLDCPNLIRTIPQMIPDSSDIEDLDTTMEDHAVDSCGYFLLHMPWINANQKLGEISKQSIPYKPQMPITNQGEFIGIDLKAFEEESDNI